ncbi:MAG TPA: YeeE/YedE thiosulfate transporter family protein [Thermoanaerobaculia bacterium]|nr:YeeE/YedE thiosulfate transporter family protein [Thermoanaerobaculia bacterium]
MSADAPHSGAAGSQPAGPVRRADSPPLQYADPYLAGAALGVVLLAAFAFAGRGLGASGAFTTTAAGLTDAIAHERAVSSPLFTRYLDADGPWRDWLLFEIIGVVIGGFLSALFAGRLRRTIERGPRISSNARLAFAFTGGAAMGLGAVLARGCTSGLGLTGGALLSAGSWIFIGAAFAAGYATAPLLRKAWR